MIKQIGLPLRGRPILLMTRRIITDRMNWTPLNPVTITTVYRFRYCCRHRRRYRYYYCVILFSSLVFSGCP